MWKKHPKALPFLFFSEMWERFGYYLMIGIFTLYLKDATDGFNMDEKDASSLYGTFIALVFFTPFLGGLIADRYLGYRRSIILGGLLMGIGYCTMGVQSEAMLYLSMTLVIIGNGFFKPNISTMVGNLYSDNDPKKDSAFNIFYMGINIGAFFAPIAAAYLRQSFGFSHAFLAASMGMVISIIIFTVFKKHILYADSVNHKDNDSNSLNLTPKQEKDRIKALITIFAIVILFWMAFNQNGFTLIFWARDCTNLSFVPDPSTSTHFAWLYKILRSPETYQSLNPIFIVLFTVPLVWFWSFLSKKKKDLSTPAKMIIGMLLTALTYFIMYIGSVKLLNLGEGGRVSLWWLISSSATITFAELCLSPMGLAFCAKVAPRRMRGFLMGGWFAATAIGNYLSGFLGSFWDKVSHQNFFLFLVFSSLFGAFLLGLALKTLVKATSTSCEA